MPYKDPKDKTENQRSRRHRDRGLTPPPGEVPESVPMDPLPLRQPSDVLTALEEALNVARCDLAATPQVRARTVAYVASVALKALEVVDFGERLKALEAKAGMVQP